MRVLLDTHVFLWFVTRNPRLKPTYRLAIEDPANEIFLSVVSVWEATVKYGQGRLVLPAAAPAFLVQSRRKHRIAALQFPEGCISFLPRLPKLHKDPFDRMLVCQAMAFGLTLATDDEILRQYGIPTL